MRGVNKKEERDVGKKRREPRNSVFRGGGVAEKKRGERKKGEKLVDSAPSPPVRPGLKRRIEEEKKRDPFAVTYHVLQP